MMSGFEVKVLRYRRVLVQKYVGTYVWPLCQSKHKKLCNRKVSKLKPILIMADIVRQVAEEQWGLKGVRSVAVVTTDFGSRLSWVDTDAGKRYAVKKLPEGYTDKLVEKSCRFSNHVDEFLAKRDGENIRLSRFLPLVTECNDLKYIYTGSETHHFVCSSFIEDSYDLGCAQKCEEHHLTCEEVRRHMADALGALHGFATQARRYLHVPPEVNVCHDGVVENPFENLSKPENILADRVLKDIEERQSVHLRRFKNLPRYPVSGRMQAENLEN